MGRPRGVSADVLGPLAGVFGHVGVALQSFWVVFGVSLIGLLEQLGPSWKLIGASRRRLQVCVYF